MDKYELIKKIEEFAPLETQEPWDFSGWLVDNDINDIKRVMVALTVTEDVFGQAVEADCDLIITHHPMFTVPYGYRHINIYASHTPMDKAVGGTTDMLMRDLGYCREPRRINDYVRVLDIKTNIHYVMENVAKLSKNIRLINNYNQFYVKSIGFCAGSGSDFIESTDCDVFITGDVKYHVAADSEKIIIDMGHFESEIGIKRVFRELIIPYGVEVVMAYEKSPFN